ncbi:hypothetical protein CISIN_1g031142mg [Citrus sinensis]|uniref:AAA-type ATPase N-terminal domain-containing protein n=1 Tax=Citrus sinensis TaxID=2711 RepID=A0A067D534_CITSI|nr:hypothetical protein CISIN_1g031142mg [Citrus sinensis]
MKFSSEIQGFLGRLISRKQAYWNLSSCFEWNALLQPKILSFLCSHLDISLTTGERLNHSEVFSAIQNYLSIKASKHAARFKADVVEDSQSLVLSMEDKEEVTDEFERVNVWWELGKNISRREFQFSIYPAAEEKRYYKLTFHKRDRELIPGSYVNHVLDGGRPSQ